MAVPKHPGGRPRGPWKPKAKRHGGTRPKRPRAVCAWTITDAQAKALRDLRGRYKAEEPGTLGPPAERYNAVVALTTKLLRSRRPFVKFTCLTQLVYLIPACPSVKPGLIHPGHPLRTFRTRWTSWLADLCDVGRAMAVVKRVDVRVAKFASTLPGVPPEVIRAARSYWRHMSPTEGLLITAAANDPGVQSPQESCGDARGLARNDPDHVNKGAENGET